MLGLGGRGRVDAAHEEDQTPYRLALGSLGAPEAVERLAVGTVGVGEFDDRGRTCRADRQCLGRVDGFKTARGTLFLRQRGQVDAVAVVDRSEQEMLTLRRIVDDAASGACLIQLARDGSHGKILELKIRKGLMELRLGF